MATNKTKPAFPGRASAMGYEPGLSKLEWIVTQLRVPGQFTVEECLAIAKKILEVCAKAEAND